MEWLKNLLDEFEKKATEKQKRLADEKEEEEDRERRIQEQWEAAVDNTIRPILEEIEKDFKEKDHLSKIVTDSVTPTSGKAKLSEIALEFGKQKGPSGFTARDHSIKFSRKPLQDTIQIDFYHPETPEKTEVRKIFIGPRSLKIDEISRKIIEEDLKGFLYRLFS